MSFAQTQYLAVGLNIVGGLILAAFGDFNLLLGPPAMYVLVFPALVIHLACGLCEGEDSRREWARLYPAIDVEAEERRIASAGYPEQHRLFMENRLLRERLRRSSAAADASPTRPPIRAATHAAAEDASAAADAAPAKAAVASACSVCGYVSDKRRRRCPRCATPYD